MILDEILNFESMLQLAETLEYIKVWWIYFEYETDVIVSVVEDRLW